MKAIRTIVATAVIVLALTTVAMAGVQRLGNGTDAAAAAQAQPIAAPAAAHAGEVTLSARQFAALLRAVAGQDRARAAHQERATDRTRARDRARSHVDAHEATHASHSTPGSGGSTHHATTQTHTQTHHGGIHDAGTHDGGIHDGGCD
jgi:hypothetical protein